MLARRMKESFVAVAVASRVGHLDTGTLLEDELVGDLSGRWIKTSYSSAQTLDRDKLV